MKATYDKATAKSSQTAHQTFTWAECKEVDITHIHPSRVLGTCRGEYATASIHRQASNLRPHGQVVVNERLNLRIDLTRCFETHDGAGLCDLEVPVPKKSNHIANSIGHCQQKEFIRTIDAFTNR